MAFMRKSPRQRHKQAYLFGTILAAGILSIMFSPIGRPFIMAGPVIIGHETLPCTACHKDERGTLRQRLQANVRYILDQRQSGVSLGYRPVENSECLHCHERPNDQHPVYRFLEPKYRQTRETIGAHRCTACHREHTGHRISISADFCQHCHDKLSLKQDPLDVTHLQLVKTKRWQSCLTCHDFHGNHEMKLSNKLEQAISMDKINAYFNRGPHAYPGEIMHKARKHDDDE